MSKNAHYSSAAKLAGPEALFTAHAGKVILDDHLKLAMTHTSLANTHALVGAELKKYLDHAEHRVYLDFVEDVYEGDIGEYRFSIVFQTFSATSLSKKRMPNPCTQLQYQRMRKLIQDDWGSRYTENNRNEAADRDAVLKFLAVLFSQHSGSCIYQVEHDDRIWGITFLDNKTNSSLDVEISR